MTSLPRLAFASALCAAACHHDAISGGAVPPDGGPAVASDPNYASGSRIKLIRVRGEGADYVVGFQDTKLGLPCAWHEDPDGNLRCYPTGTLTLENQFTDPSCTQPIALGLAAGCFRPTVLRAPARDRCDEVALFRAGPATPLATFPMYYSLLTDGRCLPTTNDADYLTFAPGAPLPREALAVGHRRKVTATGRLSAQVVESEDGARGRWRLFDETLQHDCVVDRATDGELRCLPRGPHATELGFFADAACTQREVSEPQACDRDRFVLRPIADTCPPRKAVVQVGEPVPDQYLLSSNQGCVLRGAGSELPQSHYREGPEVSATELASIERMVEAAPGRLRQYLEISSAGQQRTAVAFDSVLGVDCSEGLASDGVLRCLPSAVATVGVYFADDQCTVPLARTASACPPMHGLWAQAGVCPARFRVLSVGQPYTGPLYFVGSRGCRAISPSGRFFSVGTELPAASFARLEMIIE